MAAIRGADPGSGASEDASTTGRDGGAPAIFRALTIIELLAERPDGLSLSEIARLVDANKAIVHRVIGALDQAGYLFRSEETGNYRLSYKITNIGLRQISSTDFLDQSMPVLRGLADMTDELVRMAIVEGDAITWIAAVQGQRRMLQLNPTHTFHISLHTHATGKAWLAMLPRSRAITLIERAGCEARTPYSRTGLDAIEAELDRTRTQGYGLTYEEDELGVGAIAAPILRRTLRGEQECVGCVSLAAPTSRMTREQLAAAHPLVIGAAARLAERWPADPAASLPGALRRTSTLST